MAFFKRNVSFFVEMCRKWVRYFKKAEKTAPYIFSQRKKEKRLSERQ